MRRRMLSVMLTICMVLVLMPQMVFAEGGVPYLDDKGEEQIYTGSYTEITADNMIYEWTSGWYVVQGDVTIGSRVKVNGDVHLILADGCKLTVNGGIGVSGSSSKPNSLTIYGQENGTGELKACAANGTNYAGIGGDDSYYNNMGVITINGGNITAVGDGAGSGIGGGAGGAYDSITINGGTVTAKGGRDTTSSGIGAFVGNATTADITISGGTVMATGGYYGINASPKRTIITGENGHAVIFASHTGQYGSALRDNGMASRSGVIFEGNSGQIYGSSVTPSEDFTIPADKTLTIESENSLTIPAGKTLSIENGGTLANNGKIYVDGTLTGSVDSSSTGSIFYLLTLEGATASGFDSTYNEKTYAKAGSAITLSAEPQIGKIITWESSPRVDINDNRFTMPSSALTVTAKWIECMHKGETEIRNNEAATCTKEGYSGDKYCLVCNAMITKGNPINMSAHKLNHIPKTDATVTETGHKEYWQCTVCQKYFSDADGKNEISNLDAWKDGPGRIDRLIPPKIDSVSSDRDGNVSVSIEKSIVTTDGKTEASITDAVAESILDKLASSESKSVVINASAGSISSKPAASGASTEISISGAALKKLSEVEDIRITFVTDNGKIVLDGQALAAASKIEGGDGRVTLVIETVEQTESILKLDLKIKASSGDVTDFGGGIAAVTVAISDELKGRNPVCVYIDAQGIYHMIGGKVNDDGTFTFVTGHFSTYAIMPEEEAAAVIKEQTADAQKAAIKKVKPYVSLTTKKVKKGIKVTVKVPSSQKADKTGVIIYRSKKKSSGYVEYKRVKTSGSSYTVTNTKNIKGKRLVKGKKYYYKARAYKVIDGKTYYGPMSSIKYAKAR